MFSESSESMPIERNQKMKDEASTRLRHPRFTLRSAATADRYPRPWIQVLKPRQATPLPGDQPENGPSGNSTTVTIALSATFGVLGLLLAMLLISWALTRDRSSGDDIGDGGGGRRGMYQLHEEC